MTRDDRIALFWSVVIALVFATLTLLCWLHRDTLQGRCAADCRDEGGTSFEPHSLSGGSGDCWCRMPDDSIRRLR